MSKPIIFAVEPQHAAREGLTTTVAPWEDGQRASPQRGTFEWWYFDAHLDDGTTAVIIFLTKPLISPGSPLTPNLNIAITRADGSKINETDSFPANQFSASSEKCDIHIGPNWAKHTAQGTCWNFELHAETDGMTADLTFTGLVPPWRPGAGKIFFGDDDHFVAWLPSLPYGTVTGTLAYDGQIHSVQGSGYHDHNWGNIALPSVVDHWYWGRAHIGNYTVIYVDQVAAKQYGSVHLPVFLLAKGEQVVADESRFFTMQARQYLHHASGREYPQEVDFTWARGQEKIQLAVRNPTVIEEMSLLTTLPPLQRALARIVANPYYFRFNAELDIRIDLANLHDHIHGPTLYEMMLLK